jgi:hypothetical protein
LAHTGLSQPLTVQLLELINAVLNVISLVLGGLVNQFGGWR